MARVLFNASDIDQQYQIEEGIRRTLDSSPVASVRRSVIDSNYELEEDDGETIDGSVEQKCQQIANRLNLAFSLTDELAVFRPKRK